MAMPEDAATVLDTFINDVSNLPAEVAHLLEELSAKDRLLSEHRAAILTRDTSIQKFIRINGAIAINPKEESHTKSILANYDRAQAIQEEKVALAEKAGVLIDRHLRRLDVKIRDLIAEGAMPSEPALPSLLHPTPGNRANGGMNAGVLGQANGNMAGGGVGPPTAITGTDGTRLAQPGLGQSVTRSPISADGWGLMKQRGGAGTASAFSAPIPSMATATAMGTSSAPSTPAASGTLALQQQQQQQRQRESSAGATDAKRRRLNPHLSSLPTTSSGLARTSSLGPGTPKLSTPGLARAGSAGPRTSSVSGVIKRSGSVVGAMGRKMAPHQVQMRRKLGNKLHSQTAGAVMKKNLLGKKLKGSSDDAMEGIDGGSQRDEGSAGEDSAGDTIKRASGSGKATMAAKGKGGKVVRGKPKGGPKSETKEEEDDDDEDMADVSSPVSGQSDNEAKATSRPTFPGGHRHTHSFTSGGDDGAEGTEGGDGEEVEGEDHRKYCTCRNVSYGNMVACDNEDCPYEWFHWQCVGMTREPGGEWFCGECREKLGL